MRKSFAFAVALALAAPAWAQQELKYAVIVSRHGVRAPTWTLERLNEYSTAPWPDFGVAPGILTAHGRALMKIMGAYYRESFSRQGLLGKPDCADATRTYIWADTDQRTMETARALAEGMLPGCKADVHSVGEGDDPLFDPIAAGRVKPDAKLALAAVTGRIGPKLDALVEANRPAFDALTEILNGRGKAAKSIFDEPLSLNAGKSGVAMAGPLSTASTFTENLLLEYADGMSGERLGWGRLDKAKLNHIMSLHTAYADLMRRTPYLARLRGGGLLTRVLDALTAAATGKQEQAMLLISGHDTNISNLSGLLGLTWQLPTFQRDDAPPGGAMIFTLWRSAAGAYSVRVQFVAATLDQMHDATPLSLSNPPAIADLFLPGCSTANEGFACDWAAFQRTARTAASQ